MDASAETLQDMYLGQKLSISQIASKLSCSGTTVLRRLQKYNIQRRPAYPKKIDVPKDVLADLYWNKKMKPREIAKLYGIKNERTIRKKMEKFGIVRRTLSEAMTTKLKLPFTGDLVEKAYLLGLRTGDFHAKWMKLCIRVQTSTTHPALYELLRRSFGKYGEPRKYLYKNAQHGPEWFIYVDLNSSFDFLVNKPDYIPEWILNDNDSFFAFLTAYSDCESYWNITNSHNKYLRSSFNISTCDKHILEDIKNKLFSLGYFPLIYLKGEQGTNRGYGKYNYDLYNITLNRKTEVTQIIAQLIRFSKHDEKIDKMHFILNYQDSLLSECSSAWLTIKRKINEEKLR